MRVCMNACMSECARALSSVARVAAAARECSIYAQKSEYDEMEIILMPI